MENKHTPGPWEYEKTASHTNGREYFIVYHQENGVVADMPYNHIKNAEANARLIAAAPELLEACKYVVKWHRENDSGEGELYGLDFVTTCIGVIRKAEGGE